MISNFKLINLIAVLSIIIGILFRVYNIGYEDLWFDEIATFWVTDPAISFKEMLSRHTQSENTPQLYYIILYQLHKFFNYDPNFGRYFSSFIGIASIFSLTYLCKILSKNESYKFCFFLISLNVFHIIYSVESRVYSLLFFVISLTLIFIIKYLKSVIEGKDSIYFLYLYFFFQITSILIFPFSIILYAALLFYSLANFIFKKINFRSLNICLFFLFLFIILNIFINYYGSKTDQNINWITQPDLKFFTDFYFSKFFGSRLMGVIHLMILIYLIINFKNRIFNLQNPLIFLFIFLIFSYLIPLFIGFYKPIILARYIIFVLIPILLVISISTYDLEKRNIRNVFLYLIIILTLGNHFTEQNIKQFFQERVKYKPEFKKTLIFINQSNIKNYSINLEFSSDESKLTFEKAYFNYFNFIDKKENLNLIPMTNQDVKNNLPEYFWVLCSTLVNGEKCFNNKNIYNPKYSIVKTKNFNNVVLKLLKYN